MNDHLDDFLVPIRSGLVECRCRSLGRLSPGRERALRERLAELDRHRAHVLAEIRSYIVRGSS